MTSTTATSGTQVQHLDPTTLLIDTNVRHDPRVDEDFTASIRDLGVLVPIVAVRTSDGGIRVRFGHRRTAAAVQAGLVTVPVVVAADEATTDEATIDRLLGQYAENEHRAGLTNAERVGVFGQLAAFGVSPARIAKRTRTPRAQVQAALSIAGSDLAKAVTARYDWLDLTQSAVCADFDDDPEAVKVLVVAAQQGRFDHAAERLRADRIRARVFSQFATDLRARGTTVLDDAETGVALQRLRDENQEVITPEGHQGCPGHAASIIGRWGHVDPDTGLPPVAQPCQRCGAAKDEPCEEVCFAGKAGERGEEGCEKVWDEYPAVRWMCTDAASFGHEMRVLEGMGGEVKRASEMTEDERAASKAARRDVIESNKAWKAAETVRRAWLKAWANRKTLPQGAGAFLATALGTDPDTFTRISGNNLAADMLGCERRGYGRSSDLLATIGKVSDARALVLTMVLILTGYEDSLDQNDWRTVRESSRRYLEELAELGYTLSDVERRACGENPLTTA